MEIGIGIIFALFGLAALILSVGLIRASLRRQRNWRKSQGVVINYRESHRNGQVVYRREIQFTDDGGKQHIFAAGTASQKRFNKIGDSIALLYSPDAPEKAVVNSFSDLYAGPTIIALLAIGFLGLGCVLLLG
jgi:hypothetical protein